MVKNTQQFYKNPQSSIPDSSAVIPRAQIERNHLIFKFINCSFLEILSKKNTLAYTQLS